MASNLPEFELSTQADLYWAIPLLDAEGTPLSIEGRVFEAWVAPATVMSQGVGEPAKALKVLTFGDGLTLVTPVDKPDSTVKNTLVHRVSREFAQANFPRGALTADILEVVDGSRRRFIPVRLNYQDPAAIRSFVPDAVGITFGGSRQPVVTPVAIAGREGARGAGFLTGQGAPTSTDGEEGDYWIDAATDPRILYGPKADGAWPPQGGPITSTLTPALLAARDAALNAAAGAQAGAEAVAADRQAVDIGAEQVEGARQIVVTAQVLVSQDASLSAAAREAARLARDEALQAQGQADAQRIAAQAAAAEAEQLARLVGALAYDMGTLDQPSDGSSTFDMGML